MTPQAKRINTTAGEPVVLRVSSDTDDELHVHSSPEQTFEVKAGMRDESVEITIDRPGQVAVESHDLGVVVQLVVEP